MYLQNLRFLDQIYFFTKFLHTYIAQSTEAIEYTDCTSAEG